MFNIFKTPENFSPSGKVISILNQKGGVGKTTMSFNLAHALAKQGKKVLCIDMDPQSNLSLLFGHDTDSHTYSLYHLLVNAVKELKPIHTNISIADVLIRTSNEMTLDLLPSAQALSGFELTVAGISFPRQLILKKLISMYCLDEIYDCIIVDGPPTLGLLVVNILCASNGIMVPFAPDQFSRKGLEHFHNVIVDIEDMGISDAPKIIGYIPNLVDGRRKQHKKDFQKIKDNYTEGHFFSPFSNKVQLVKSSAECKSVFDFNQTEFKELQDQFSHLADYVSEFFDEK
jgi:chromosome partitioning protein